MTPTTADAFVAAIRPPRPPKIGKDGQPVEPRITEDTDFVAMVYRQIRALELRAIERAEILPQVLGLAQRLNEVVNVAIAANAERYALDPMLGASRNECAKVLGVSPQAAGQRKQLGEQIMRQRLEAANAARLGDKRASAEAARERAAIDAATEHAVTNLAEYRARHARRVA